MNLERWSYGVTAVRERLDSTLPITLESLERAGFPEPRLFLDGELKRSTYKLSNELTQHCPKLGAYGNWVLALWELYVRKPNAERFALFQDDILLCKNVRQYLERCLYPRRGYWNLYTRNENIPASNRQGWQPSLQGGRGALALVFNRPSVTDLLAQQPFIAQPQDKDRGTRNVDGVVFYSMRNVQRKEYIHLPSLVQHNGPERSIRVNAQIDAAKNLNWHQTLASTFEGEQADAGSLPWSSESKA